MQEGEAFGGSVLSDTDDLSILTPETASDILLRHAMKVT